MYVEMLKRFGVDVRVHVHVCHKQARLIENCIIHECCLGEPTMREGANDRNYFSAHTLRFSTLTLRFKLKQLSFVSSWTLNKQAFQHLTTHNDHKQHSEVHAWICMAIFPYLESLGLAELIHFLLHEAGCLIWYFGERRCSRLVFSPIIQDRCVIYLTKLEPDSFSRYASQIRLCGQKYCTLHQHTWLCRLAVQLRVAGCINRGMWGITE